MYSDLPINLKRFLIRGTLLFIAWELIYNFIVIPYKVPNDQLTALVVYGTGKILNLFYNQVTIIDANIFINNNPSIFVAESCNGLELIVLYIGFMLCLPTSAKRFWAFTVVGFIVITILNIFRCAALAALYYNHHPLADFAHHYAFKLIIYIVIFYGWVLYSKQIKPNETGV